MDRPLVSLVMVLKDEAQSIGRAIASIFPWINEFVWLDTGSEDGTQAICWAHHGRVSAHFGAQVYVAPEDMNFGFLKTRASRMAISDFIFLLDGDETVTGGEHLLQAIDILDRSVYDAMAFPRRRWADLGMTQQVEVGAYPDRQLRLYRNDPDIYWVGILHEALTDSDTRIAAEQSGKTYYQQGHMPHLKSDLLTIEHFTDYYHLADPERRAQRAAQRRILAQRAGVPVEGSDEARRLAGMES